MPPAQQFTKEIEGSEWEELYFHHREMSKAAEAKKPSESQKAKAFWAMKAAKDREEEYCDPARKDHILGRRKTRLERVGRAPQRPNHCLGHSSEAPRKSLSGLTSGSRFLREVTQAVNGLRLDGLRRFAKDVGKTVLGRRLALRLDPWDSVRLRTASSHSNVPGKYMGRMAELFFFLIK